MAESWKKVGTLRKSKSGGLYIKVEEGVTLTKDAVLQLQDPRKKLQQAVEAGRMEESVAKERIAKVPDFIRYEIFLVPPK
jgi:hypothetical protein